MKRSSVKFLLSVGAIVMYGWLTAADYGLCAHPVNPAYFWGPELLRRM
jgi:hypothetical protein